MQDKILVFVPMYNCQNQITRVVSQLKNKKISKHIFEVIVVNNISTDDGEQILTDFIKNDTEIDVSIKVLRNDQNYGLGGSHKVAFNYAIDNKFDYLIVLHGDDQGSIADLSNILENKTYKNYDCCLGSRFMKGSALDGYSKFRTFGNRVYNMIFSVCTFTNIKDMGSGLNMYDVNMLKSKFYIKFHDGLMFNNCMLLANGFYKINALYFPISWREDDQVSNVKLVSQAFKTLDIGFGYMFSKKDTYINKDFREKNILEYTSTTAFKKDMCDANS